MIKLVKAKYSDDVIECYPLARFLYSSSEKEEPHYLVYVPEEETIAAILVEEILEPMDEITASWVKADDFTSHLPEDYCPSEFLVKQFFGEKFILDRSEFMCLWEEMEEEECLEILREEKPELFR
ncbi:hypothetical protein EI71_00468 [Anaeroplasma bactoclasticum]|jgi:hypothetical protein|uniref:Uncharacterized protein n=1 Tax=Anaeroplasma bactoclasticum TaxID=2088 RepID=A0A397S029_9MOLU|nr:hypothetical protein [Anaeroplasma bactoclasticum]RIA78156.1 hypothetical protein EI71_00468 [Anaeroplasma bactoclasticum]